MATKATDTSTGQASDLAQLWQAAIQSYEQETGQSLQLGKFRSMDDVMNGTEALSQKFKDFRDDKSKVSKVRTAFKNNMWLIQGIVSTVETVGNAASVSSCLQTIGNGRLSLIIYCT